MVEAQMGIVRTAVEKSATVAAGLSQGLIETPEQLKIIALGEQAIEVLKKTFGLHMEIMRGAAIGREWAMADSGTDDISDRSYGKAYGRWLDRHPKYRVFNKVYLHWRFRCLDHEDEILKWRAAKGDAEQANYHYPETVFKRWARVERPDLLTAKQAGQEPTRKRAPAARVHDAVDRLEQRIETMDRRLGPELADLLDLSTPESVESGAHNLIDIYGWDQLDALIEMLRRLRNPAPALIESTPLDDAFQRSLGKPKRRTKVKKTMGLIE